MDMSQTWVHPQKLPRAFAPTVGPDNRMLQEFEIDGLARIYWPETQVENVRNIARCESGWWTGAWAKVGEDSRGLLQLNLRAHPQLAAWNLFDPQINFYFAHQLWLAQGWRPWTCADILGIV